MIEALSARFQRNSHVNWNNRVSFYLCINNELSLTPEVNALEKVIVLDSFSVLDEKYLGQGNMKGILDFFVELSDKLGIPFRINSVINKRLISYLERYDLHLKPGFGGSAPSFFYIPKTVSNAVTKIIREVK